MEETAEIYGGHFLNIECIINNFIRFLRNIQFQFCYKI